MAVFGANLGLGQPKEGVERTYSWLKSEGLFGQAFDAGTLEQPSQDGAENFSPDSPLRNTKNFSRICAFCRELSDRICDLNARFDLSLNVGGDHSVAMGSIAGSLQSHPQTKVIWVDAHADFNTPRTSPSGNVHGMPLSFITGYFKHPETDAHLQWMPRLNPANLAIIGLRDLDIKEPDILKELGVLHFSAEDVRRQGIAHVMREVVSNLDPEASAPLHLSLDVDAIDPAWFPCTGTTVEHGLTLEEGEEIVKTLFQTGRLKTFDLVEINPALGDENDVATTLASTRQLLRALK